MLSKAEGVDIMPTGTSYRYGYNHKRKEVIISFQVGTTPPVELVIGVEAFFQDIDFIRGDRQLAHFLAEVRKRKELPSDHDFGPGGGEIKFNPDDWEGKMKDGG